MTSEPSSAWWKVLCYVLAPIALIFLVVTCAYFYKDPETKTMDDKEREKIGSDGAYVKLSDGITHYKISGTPSEVISSAATTTTGKYIVVVHGGTFPMWAFERQLDTLHAMGYCVLSYDQYGRGYSDKPYVDYDQQLYVRQLRELVRALNFDDATFDVMGISLGCGIIANYVAQYPEKVGKLVLCCPLVKTLIDKNNFRLKPLVGEMVIRFVGIKNIYSNKLFIGCPDKDLLLARFFEQAEYRGFQRTLLSLARNDALLGDYTEAYKKIAQQEVDGGHPRKILIMWGTHDTTITKDMIDELLKILPNALFEQLEGFDHGFIMSEPKTVNAHIKEFL